MSKPHILLVEDDQSLREALCTTLDIAGFRYHEADSAETALSLLERQKVDMVVSDINMPGMDGHGLLQQIREHHPMLPVLLMTAYGQISHAVSAIQNGAVDYLVKPFEPQVLVDAVRKVVAPQKSKRGVKEPVAEETSSKQTLQLARQVALSDSTVLISGESGTGKEVLAQYIHRHSQRAEQPFVALNCAAIPENMLEAMLFGHEKGAFTGAYNSAPGKFEQANQGTILLDEISEMDLSLQAKLLRVLQEREVERVGGRKTIKLDVRVIATTNRDLKQSVAEGKFREDLYYRLSVFPLQWQPLRERRRDIVPLANRMLAVYAEKMQHIPVRLSVAAEDALLNHNWPGNVRELDNAIQRALILQSGDEIQAADLRLEGASTGSVVTPLVPERAVSSLPMEDDRNLTIDEETAMASSALGKDLKMREFQLIIDTLRELRGKRKQAAERLGISPRTLRYKIARMRECGIHLEEQLARAS